ncbi:pentapeptide repeat-containing protein, partial [Escherichia marmotae]|nr:pentapeptide repeat-containing protein [Escherichia marmotae]
MLRDNHDEAVYMGFWDKFCDLFRPEKKKDVLEAVWTFLQQKNEENGESPEPGSREELSCMLSAFRKLRSFADSERRNDFRIKMVSDWSDGCCKWTTTFTVGDNCVSSQCMHFRENIDLSDIDLRRVDLSGADLTGAN